MKKIFAILVLALLGVYFFWPSKSISALTITIEDDAGAKITSNAKATFLDADGQTIATVELGHLPSWDNNIHWFANSEDPEVSPHPDDARRAIAAVVRAQDCGPVRVPVALTSSYAPPSIMPHGAGPAYMYYEFRATVRLKCGKDVDTIIIRDAVGASAIE